MYVFPNETLQFLLTSQPQRKKPIFFTESMEKDQ